MARRPSDWSPAWRGGVASGSRSRALEPRGVSKFVWTSSGSGFVEQGLSWDEGCLLAFLVDAQSDLTPAPPARAQQACPPPRSTNLRGHGSRSPRQGSSGFLGQCISSTRAHASTRGERCLTGPRRLCAVPSCLSILGPERRPPPWRCWRAGSRASCSGTAS